MDPEVLRFRAEFGLPTDTVTLGAAEASRNDPELMEYGVPLLPTELEDLHRREEIGSSIPGLAERLERDHPSIFGGAYMDQANRGVVDVAFTVDPDQFIDVVKAVFPPDATIRLREVDNSLMALREVQADLDRRASELAERGVEVWNTGVQIRTNRVELAVSSAPAWLMSDIAKRYGTRTVSVEVPQSPPETTHCVSRDHCTDSITGSTLALRAGTHLYDAGCSLGFGAIFDETGTKGILTAGHCADLVPAGHNYQHPNDTAHGPMLRETWKQGTSADAGFVDVPDWRVTNRVYSSYLTWYEMKYQQTKSEEYIGMPVCMSGRMRGETVSCGELYMIDASPVLSGVQTYNQRTATYTSASGDSGGAVFKSMKAFGIQSGRLGDCCNYRAVYSHISYVLSKSYGVDATLILVPSS